MGSDDFVRASRAHSLRSSSSSLSPGANTWPPGGNTEGPSPAFASMGCCRRETITSLLPRAISCPVVSRMKIEAVEGLP